MKVNDAISGLFFILFGMLIFYLTRDFPIMPGQKYGADLFPRLIGFFMGLGGAALIVRGVRTRDGAPWVTVMDWVASPRHVMNFFLVIAVLIFLEHRCDPRHSVSFLPLPYRSYCRLERLYILRL